MKGMGVGKDVIDETGIDPAQLELEITESVAMLDADFMVCMLAKLKGMGITIAIDDFGTGFSSLSYLERLKVDRLKIDRSFVRDINSDNDDAAIAHAVIAMAHSLGLHVIAEGVETEAQLELLRSYQCDYFQGYLFSRPIPAEEFTLILKNGKQLTKPSSPSCE